ncbi:phosphatidate cytidylyltransferase [Amylibacter kogurei]|uniref:Phosphatidate cytidylyltransferase n=1 Tax=Paramylibacter kogurei TaxID=1889778 RepID=A0A2G5K3H5_9RHOB|nr:phosphatidate cytidylyltransferase [Amylibacter kogurei]PIB23460.1 phosphatidate cytidylyltransferase [Amylibacter kogurei]
MTEQPDLIYLLLMAGAALIVATLIAHYLMSRQPEDDHSPIVDTFNAYILSWWGVTGMIAFASLGGRVGLIVLFAFCSFAAMREFMTLTTKNRDDHWVLAAGFFAILPIQYILLGYAQHGMFAIFIPVYAFLFLPILAAIKGNAENFLVRVSETQWAMMITVYCASHIPALLDLEITGFSGRNVLLIAFLMVVVQAGDLCHFLWAKIYGRTKMAPKLEKSKTWEGFVGGIASATLVGAFLWWLTPFEIWQATLLAMVISLIGFCGGMVMATIKIDRGVKDWGDLIPGHGGFIDRFGSVVFAAPIFYHLVRYFFANY